MHRADLWPGCSPCPQQGCSGGAASAHLSVFYLHFLQGQHAPSTCARCHVLAQWSLRVEVCAAEVPGVGWPSLLVWFMPVCQGSGRPCSCTAVWNAGLHMLTNVPGQQVPARASAPCMLTCGLRNDGGTPPRLRGSRCCIVAFLLVVTQGYLS